MRQLVDAAYKAYKICHFVGLKESHCNSLRFLRKAPTKNSDILFGSDYKRENLISQAADDNSILVRCNERVVIMHSYADAIEMKRANVRNYAFVRRVIEMKRMSVT